MHAPSCRHGRNVPSDRRVFRKAFARSPSHAAARKSCRSTPPSRFRHRTRGGRHPDRAFDPRLEHLFLGIEVPDLPSKLGRSGRHQQAQQPEPPTLLSTGESPNASDPVHQPVENRAHPRHSADIGPCLQSPTPATTPGRKFWTPVATRPNARFPAPAEGFGGVLAVNVV